MTMIDENLAARLAEFDAWKKQTAGEPVEIVDTKTGAIVGKYKPGKTAFHRAMKRADKLDLEYGAHRYRARFAKVA